MSPTSPAWVVGHKNIRLVSPITMINIHDPPTLYWVRWPTDWYLQKYRFLSRRKSIRRFILLGVPSLLISYSSIISSLALCTSRDFMLFRDFLSYMISEHVPSCRGCNGGPSLVPRPKVLPEGRPILHCHNYTLTINNNYRMDHYCCRFSYYYKNQSSTM